MDFPFCEDGEDGEKNENRVNGSFASFQNRVDKILAVTADVGQLFFAAAAQVHDRKLCTEDIVDQFQRRLESGKRSGRKAVLFLV